MDMTRRFLIALHPKAWRERYGEEFAALLQDTRLTPSAVANVAGHAAGAHLRAHRAALLMMAAAALVSVTCEIAALRAGLTANILWAPTAPLRALTLLGAAGPWAAVLAFAAARHRSARRA